MFVHNKRLMYTLRVSEPNPRLATLMLEQFGGPQGELAAQCATSPRLYRKGGEGDATVMLSSQRASWRRRPPRERFPRREPAWIRAKLPWDEATLTHSSEL